MKTAVNLLILFCFVFFGTYTYANTMYCSIDSYIKEDLNRYPASDKVAYLTFDDGPSKNVTPKILTILQQYDVNATFFTIGTMMEKYPDTFKDAYKRGHSIGNHTYSHNFNNVYKDLDSFVGEIKKWENTAKAIIGENFETKIMRFPGGSFDKGKKFKENLTDLGYTFYDWNALNGDSELKDISMEYLIKRTNETVKGKDELIFLMHDTDAKEKTVNMLPYLIHKLRKSGYRFEAIRQMPTIKCEKGMIQ